MHNCFSFCCRLIDDSARIVLPGLFLLCNAIYWIYYEEIF